MERIEPFVIGIGGRSCSGKSTAVREVERKNREVLCINQDEFFRAKAENWERPDALLLDEFSETIRKLKRGQVARIPSRRFTEVFDREVWPSEIIIVEGFLLFVNESSNGLFDKRIWIDVSDLNIALRRSKRKGCLDNADYVTNVVIPESRRYEEIQRGRADIVIDGNKQIDAVQTDLERCLGAWRQECRMLKYNCK